MKFKASIIIIFMLIPIFLYSDEYNDLLNNSIPIILSNTNEARANVKKAIQLNPELGPAYIINGIIYYKVDKEPIKAGAEFKRGIGLITDTELRNKYIKIIDDITSTFNSQKEYDLFVNAFKEIENNNTKLAVENILKAIDENKNNSKLYYEIGYAYIDLNNFNKAQYYLEEGRKINPVSKKILLELKYIYSEKGDLQKLNEIIIDLIKFYGDDPTYNQELAFAYYRNKNLDLAIIALEYNIKKFPKFYASYFTLAQVYSDEKKCDKVKFYIEEFLSKSSKTDYEKIKMKIKYNDLVEKAKKLLNSCK